MKATITAGALASATGWISRALPARPPVPILGGIVVDATEHDVELAAFDYDLCARGRLGSGVVSVDEPERVVVPGRLLAAVSKALGFGEQAVTLAVENDTMVVTAGPRTRWTMPLLQASEYPALPDMAPVVGEIEPDALTASIDRVLPATSRDETLQMLTGAAISASGTALTMAATDRYRLAVCDTTWTPSVGELAEHLAPSALLKLAVTAAAGVTGQVSVRSDDGILGFSTAQRSMSGRLIGAEFPRWRALDIGPDAPGFKHRATAVVRTAALREAAQRAAVSMDSSSILVLTFTPDEIAVTASGEGVGDAAHHADVLHHEGDSVAVQIRDEYLRDALQACGDQAVRLDVGRGRILVRPAGEDGQVHDSYRHTVMTVRFPGGDAVRDA
ncbi:DNA polymerase III subunit beta [Actinomycetospora termitidis]|uniref:DNA polymerase III subunit beta n=1 Tax=Actinomycetospora termitidis TaxID=3053470 RepID=A0ABT7MJC3_9PSEU|nr:DNA polymerase III subunit beta [Actinomycetospora sp. Odt1-22]MDL5159463.1 DNA polymerase III subunit beta [Actinomycetospora sp. Odt1-22]